MGRPKGFKMSEEQKKKISAANKGCVAWNTGRSLTEEHKANISKGGKGKVITKAAKRNMSISKKKQHQDPVFRTKFMEGQKRRHVAANNKLELIMIDLLNASNLNYEFQKIINYKYLVDFYLPELNLIVEVDGAIHLYKERIARDNMRDKYFKDNGYEIAHFTIKELNKFKMFINRLKKVS